MLNEPKVSVVIVVLNGALTIARTLQSLSIQTHRNIEVLVKDGGSTDGTLDVLRAHSSLISWLASGRDSGIYDAFNLALDHATGDWICFIGSDDYFCEQRAIAKLVTAADRHNADLVCAKVAVVKDKKILQKIGQPWNWNRLKRFQHVAHVGMLHRKKLFDMYGKFDRRFKIAGDYHFLLRLGPSLRAAFVDEILVHMESTGLSHQNIAQVLRETRTIQSEHVEIGPTRAYLNYLAAWAKVPLRKLRWVLS